ncbi:MAG: endonuclease/exonuclease/phosphatase (EEP) superfamily protein YafD [Planctomycetota bacterium]|jgi:endonuclease/exonuclease/phosphatase (EEP) superfamily protein YafD
MPEDHEHSSGALARLGLLALRMAAAVAGGALMLGWFAADSELGARVVDLRHLLGLALLGLGLGLAIGRRRRTAMLVLALGLSACANGWWLGIAAKPEPVGGAELRVGSANLLFGIAHPTPLGAWIEAQDLDVLGLQEVLDSDRSKLNWPRILESWRERFPYQWVEQHEHFGMALLSRIPFERGRVEYVGAQGAQGAQGSQGSQGSQGASEGGRPVALQATLEWGGGTRVVVVHPVRPGDAWRQLERERFFGELGRELGAQQGRLLLMGDCNATGASPHWQGLLRAARLVDSRVGFGRLPSWAPKALPKRLNGSPAQTWAPKLLALDHLLVRGLVTVDRGVGPEVRSDHAPVHAVFQVATDRAVLAPE